MPNWINPSTIPIPQRRDYPSVADFMLDFGIWVSLQNADLNFLNNNDPDKANPQTYVANQIRYAFSLTQNYLNYAPPNWDWSLAGTKAAMKCFTYLDQIAENNWDPNAVSVFQAWQNQTGKLYGK